MKSRVEANIVHPLGRARVRLGLPRTRVAAALGVDYVTLWRWETLLSKAPGYALEPWENQLYSLSGAKKPAKTRKKARP